MNNHGYRFELFDLYLKDSGKLFQIALKEKSSLKYVYHAINFGFWLLFIIGALIIFFG